MDQEWTWTGSGSGPELDNFIDFIDLSDLVIVTQVCFGMKTLKVLRKAFRRLNSCLDKHLLNLSYAATPRRGYRIKH